MVAGPKQGRVPAWGRGRVRDPEGARERVLERERAPQLPMRLRAGPAAVLEEAHERPTGRKNNESLGRRHGGDSRESFSTRRPWFDGR